MATRLYRWLLSAALLLALLVVVLGAYVRLSAAGLSCPDWPGCYGQLTVAAALAHTTQIDQQYPDHPLDASKARKEMVHRYAAGTLGVLIFLVALLRWRLHHTRRVPTLLVSLVVTQALLGMWTVTLGLRPWVVTAHLLGGMSVLALLWWLWLESRPSPSAGSPQLRLFARAALLLLAVQIILGGWTSSHYAGLACTGFPGCNGAWWPPTDFAAAFGEQPLDGAGLVTIHWVHRLGALLVLLSLGGLAWRSREANGSLRRIALSALLLLLLQVAIGIANVLNHLPLPLAAAHNAIAALLLLSLVALNQRLTPQHGGAP